MSDNLKIISLNEHTAWDLLVEMVQRDIPLTAYVSTDMAGENALYFEWNDDE